MTGNDKSEDQEQVSCEVCMKEIPVSEARSSEASDYVHHFCGAECYEKWKKQGQIKED